MPMQPFTLPLAPSAGALPVAILDDVREGLPPADRAIAPDDVPVREALLEAQLAMHLAWQDRSAYAAEQADPHRATEDHLDGFGDDRDVPRRADEDDETYRARMLAPAVLATPVVLRARASALLARYSPIKPHLFEGALDRWFIGDGGAPLAFLEARPEYVDRYYDDRPQSSPPGMWVTDTEGRLLVVRMPVLSTATEARAFVLDNSVDETASGADWGWYIGDGSGALTSFVWDAAALPLEVYNALAAELDTIKGQGVRTLLITDPNLT